MPTREITPLSRVLSSCSAVALACGALAAQPAFAQQQTEGEGEFAVLEEIVVTAQKREQTLRDVPSSVATLSGERLDVINAIGSDIRFLAARVPSLNIESSFGRTFPRFYIRGLGNTDFDLNASQPVSLVVDEVVMENPVLKGFPVFDVDRIEVLRGPQGTLFGRNTPAGIVKIESKRPTHEPDGYVKASFGRFTSSQIEGAYGGSLVDDVLAARISLRHQHRDDYIDNVAPGNEETDALGGFDDFAGRFQLLYTPSENFSALLNVHGRKLFESTARVFRANIIKPGTGGIIDDFDRKEVAHDGSNEQRVDEIGAVLNMDYDFGPVTLTSVTGYEHGEVFSRGDIDAGFGAAFLGPGNFGPGFIPFPSETADVVPSLDQWTQEVRISSNELGMVDFQAGFFFFNEDLDIESLNFNTLAGGIQDGFARQRQEATSWAIFGAVDIELSPRLTLSGGVRYSEDDKDFGAERTLTPFGGPNLPLQTVHPDDEVVSWDASVTYDASEEVTLYARTAKSFRAPSVQGRVLFGDEVTVADTEEIFSVEGGLKADLFDRRARVNFTVYWFDMDDQQLTAVGGDANFNRLINAADTDGAGFEFDGEWAVTSNLMLTAGVSFNFTELDDPDLRTLPCGGGCTITDPIVDGFVQLDGNDLPQAPRWIANWTARYGLPVRNPMTGDGELYLFTDWSLATEKNFFLFESPEFRSGKEVVGGLRLGYLFSGGKYDIAAFGRNITDETELKGGIDFNNLTGFVNPPPIWGFEIAANF